MRLQAYLYCLQASLSVLVGCHSAVATSQPRSFFSSACSIYHKAPNPSTKLLLVVFATIHPLGSEDIACESL